MLSSSSILSLVLRLVELARDASTSNKQVELFENIVTLMRKNGLVNLDEVDVLLDVLKAHQFTIGDPEPISQFLATGTGSLFEAIFKMKHLRALFAGPLLQWRAPRP